MPGRNEANGDTIEIANLAVCRAFEASCSVRAEPELHDLDGFGCSEHGSVPGTRMVAMPMRDDSAFDRTRRVDIDVGWRAIKPAVRWIEPLVDGRGTHEPNTLKSLPPRRQQYAP